MKKITALLMAVFMVFSICACKKQEVNSTNDTATTTDATASGTEDKEETKVYTVDEIKQMFLKEKSFKDCEISDCILTKDNAYGLIGVIQYTDEDGNSTWLAFVKEDGIYPVGLDATGKTQIASDSVLTYIGNGTVALTLENPKTGEIFDYTMTYTYDEATNHTNFKAASNIRK